MIFAAMPTVQEELYGFFRLMLPELIFLGGAVALILGALLLAVLVSALLKVIEWITGTEILKPLIEEFKKGPPGQNTNNQGGQDVQ